MAARAALIGLSLATALRLVPASRIYRLLDGSELQASQHHGQLQNATSWTFREILHRHQSVHEIPGDPLSLLNQADEILSYVLTAVALLFLAWTFGHSAEAAIEKRAEVQEELSKLEDNYFVVADELEGQLEGIEECSALLAERNFAGKARAFQKALRGLGLRSQHKSEEALGDGHEMLELLQKFVQHWLHAFEHCSPRPHTAPLHIIHSGELKGCRDIQELATLVCKRFEKQDLHLLGNSKHKAKQLLQLRRADSEKPEGARTCRCTWFRLGCCLGCGCMRKGGHHDGYPVQVRLVLLAVTLFSPWHAGLIFSFFLTSVLLVLEVCLRKWLFVGLLVGAILGLLLAGVRIELVDAFAATERKLQQLRQAREDVDAVREVIRDFHRNQQEVTELWRFQTEPRLQHLEELLERLGDATGEERLEYLKACNECLDKVERYMGHLQAWMGSEMCPEKSRKLVSGQLKAHTDAFSLITGPTATQDRIQALKNAVFGLLVVHVRGATGLRNADYSVTGTNKSDPYVRVTIGTQTQETYYIDDNLDPVWEVDPFVFELKGGESHLSLTVWDKDYGTDDSLGQTSLDLCGSDEIVRGCWQRREDTLQPNAGQPAEGTLCYDVFLADEVTQLDWEAATPVE